MSEENVLFAKQSDTPPAEEIPAEIQSEKYLICVSDSLLYGSVAEQVVEIITDHTITYLPRVPHYVRGIINLRGQLIPIIDMRLRLGKMPEDEHCIMVVNVENNVVGLLVDGVERMADIPRDSILPMPTQNPQKLISGMCSLPDGATMLVLDCNLLLHG